MPTAIAAFALNAAIVCLIALAGGAAAPVPGSAARRIDFTDLPAALHRRWVSPQEFTTYLDRVVGDTDRRVTDGEREHLIYFALQSTSFTSKPRLEPALSSRAFVDGLSPVERRRLLTEPAFVPSAGWPAAERARMADLLDAIASSPADPRVAYFAQLLSGARAFQASGSAVDALFPDYVRVARFLYKKEFEANDAAHVAELYRTRAHSSDTQIEAGFGVYTGLGAIHALDAALRVRSVLVVGPGLDLAPRTDLVDAIPPQSYQPFAIADALLGLSLATENALQIHSVDINPRVVDYFDGLGRSPVSLHLFTGVAENPDAPFSDDYRAYLRQLGRSIGEEAEPPPSLAADRRFQRSIRVRPSIGRDLTARRMNVVTERLADRQFDLVVVTNVLTYFGDDDLALALTNMAAMLRPGGYLLHNESRGGLVEAAESVGLMTKQMRTVVLGGTKERPLYDTVWVHQKR
jgi:SAM-dependent methyltransferase